MEPWQQTLIDDIHQITTSNVQAWGSIIQKLGIGETCLKEWTSTFKEEIQDVMGAIVEEVANKQLCLIEDIEKLLKQSELLCKQLSVQMPAFGVENLGLYNDKQALEDQVKELKDKVDLRMKEINELIRREVEVCKSLGRKAVKISDCPLPSSESIEKYTLKIEALENEKYLRDEKFTTLKQEIQQLALELQFKPSIEFERQILSANDVDFIVSDVNMKMLEDFHISMVNQVETVKAEVCALREKIKSLWEILDEDLQDCDVFLRRYPGNTLDTLEGLKLEVKRCEDLKKANIEVFIKKMRAEIIDLWNKCCLTEEERTYFDSFYDDLFTEDLLTLHDIEICKLKKEYENNKELYEMLQLREDLWSKLLELEERANAPNRYKNRGGQLLKEEKERNTLSKRIPKIEEKLYVLVENYQTQVGKPFSYWGETIDSVIKKSYETRQQDKKLKLSARKQQRVLTVTPGKSTMCVAGTSTMATPNILKATPLRNDNRSNRKGGLATPLFSNRKKSADKIKHMKSAPPKIQLNGMGITKLRYSSEKKKRVDRIRRLSKLIEVQKKKNADLDYNSFEGLVPIAETTIDLVDS
ncbi:PREDICTED: protein regulator of cytokinesis 1-like isoform X2 [Nicrophorus vespilloides]|uniref:Protein regulator of cytokinesis 1-like isoform X2 n=1 Tax=Nicrophorus vespilloides TaxID=110193 RepID=A0ABM1M018_NICVS|nr:PREDICTED: protein regulator of cytokinesis 1-like isoform X2 [Nicrophorus vespilloides]